MSSTKEIWIQVEDDLREKLGREPTYEEVQDAFASFCGDLIDQAKNKQKYGD